MGTYRYALMMQWGWVSNERAVWLLCWVVDQKMQYSWSL